MNKRIIYPDELNGISVIIPSGNLTVEEVARKDVPANTKYKIVNVEDIPSDRTFRNAWEEDFTEYDGIAIGPEAWFQEQEEKKNKTIEIR